MSFQNDMGRNDPVPRVYPKRRRLPYQPAIQREVTLPSEYSIRHWMGLPKYGKVTTSDVKKGLCTTILVRGFGKRAIKVMLASFNSINQDKLAVLAAARAARLGWKKIIVQRDYGDGTEAMVVNPNQYSIGYKIGYDGKYLIDPEDLSWDWP